LINFATIKQYVLPNLPYGVLFWVFSKCGEAYRLAAGRDVPYKLMGAFKNLDTAISHPLPSFDLFDLTIGLVGAAAVYCFVLYKKKTAKKWRKDMEYGSARWGNKKDIAPFTDPKPENNVILTATELSVIWTPCYSWGVLKRPHSKIYLKPSEKRRFIICSTTV
jgi:type IV secretion system protein VirD4